MGRKRANHLGLPEFVSIEHGAYYFRRNKESRIHLGYSLPEAEAALKRIGRDPTRMHAGHLGVILSTARKNARARSLPFTLTRMELNLIWQRSGGRCELTFLPFDLVNVPGYTRRAYAPSIDRIDGKQGYDSANCRLVLVALNLAINEFGENLFAKVASAFLRYRKSRIPHNI
jgi:hypothetical protein